MKTNTLLLPLAIAAAIGLGACSQDSGYDTAADTGAEENADAMTEDTDAMASTDPATAATDPYATTPEPIEGDTAADTTAADTATMADAGPMTAPAPDLFALDANNDGSLSMDELPANDPWRGLFASADSNGDGMLSQAEIEAHASVAAPPVQQ